MVNYFFVWKVDLYVKIDSSEPLDVTLVKGKVPHMEHHRWSKCGSEYFYFILFLFYKLHQNNKQTNKQKERWQGHRNRCGQLQRTWMLKKGKKRKVKKHSDTRKTPAMYNKLLDEARNEHYYILNR